MDPRGHLDDPKRAHIRRDFLNEGGCTDWIVGNTENDRLAEQGEQSAARPNQILWIEHLKTSLVFTIRHLIIEIWAHRKGLMDKEETSETNVHDTDELDGVEDDPWKDLADEEDFGIEHAISTTCS